MADVNGGQSRGQLLVAAAVLLAVLFVALAVIVNGAIYTENLASRQENDAGAAADIRTSVTESVTALIENVNHAPAYQGASYGTLFGNAYISGLDDIAERLREQVASQGRSVSLQPASGREGTRLVQDTDETFEPRATPPSPPLATGDPNWQVAADVAVRNGQLTVERSSLADRSASELQAELDGGSAGTPFYIQVEDASGGVWKVGVAHDTGTGAVLLDIFDGSSHRTCRLDASRVTVDVARGALLSGGQTADCTALDFLDEADGTVDIYYVNGGAAVGQYEWTVDRRERSIRAAVDDANGFGCTTPTTYSGSESADPYTEPAIYATTVDVEATDDASTFETELRMAPGDQMGPATELRVHTLEIDDTSGTDKASFDITWTVTDPDGNLESVTVLIENLDQSGEDGSKTVPVSGSNAAGAFTSYEGSTGTDGDSYRITVAVSDGTDSRTVAEAEVADGTDGCGGTTNSAPTARFDPPSNPTVGDSVTFDASASDDADGSIVEYRWDFDGDGTDEETTTSATTSHTYSSAGEYDVELTVEDDDGSTGSVTETVDVAADSGSPPVVDTSATQINQDKSKEGNGQQTDTVEFVVEWSVSDPDGDLERVDLYLYQDGDTGGSYVDWVPITRVSGQGSATSGGSGDTLVWESDGSYGEQYDILVEVTDQAGNTDSYLLEQVADGDDST